MDKRINCNGEMDRDPFKEYLKEAEPDKISRGDAWSTAIGLQAVDGLRPFQYLINTANECISIHRRLFHGIYRHAGKIRDYNITKKEWVLDGGTVLYGSASELRSTLEYDFSQERGFSYKGLLMNEIIHHLEVFVSRLWQIHIFGEGNTRTTAVFFIKYMKTLGFSVTNDIFAEHSWYFRNALVRANYTNLQKGIHETTEYLELFLRNLLLNEKNELHNRYLHISGLWKMQKVDIGEGKVDIQDPKVDIENLLAVKATDFSEKTIWCGIKKVDSLFSRIS